MNIHTMREQLTLASPAAAALPHRETALSPRATLSSTRPPSESGRSLFPHFTLVRPPYSIDNSHLPLEEDIVTKITLAPCCVYSFRLTSPRRISSAATGIYDKVTTSKNKLVFRQHGEEDFLR